MKYIWYILVFSYALSYDAVTDSIARSAAPDWFFYGYEFLPVFVVLAYSLLVLARKRR